MLLPLSTLDQSLQPNKVWCSNKTDLTYQCYEHVVTLRVCESLLNLPHRSLKCIKYIQNTSSISLIIFFIQNNILQTLDKKGQPYKSAFKKGILWRLLLFFAVKHVFSRETALPKVVNIVYC